MMPLTTLPPEVLKEVLSYLDFVSLLQCSLVCSFLRTTINETSQLQYIIELGQDGLVENNPMSMSFAERLKELRQRREAWNTLSWKKASVIPMHGLCHAYELVGGLFIKAIGGRDFLVSWLPSAVEEGHQLRREDLGIRARDFAIDPGQDLIIFFEEDGGPFSHVDGRPVRLHVRSILTHEAHPNASRSTLEFSIPPSEIYGTFVRNIMMQLADDVVAVLLSSGYARLLLWNWKKGFLISDSARDNYGLPEQTRDFSFISTRAYILTTLDLNGTIQINSFESEEGFHPITVANLVLPDTQGPVKVRNVATHTAPFEVPAPSSTFFTSPNSRLHVISIQYVTNHESFRYCLFVHNRTFLSYLGETALTVPWDDWGPHHTRLFVGQVPFTWLRYVHGHKVICPQASDASIKTFQVLDFNIHSARSPEAVFNRLGGAVRTDCVESSTVPRGKVFNSDIATTLPYSATTRPVKEQYSAYMIDGERIIGLKAEGHGDEELKELHVYTF